MSEMTEMGIGPASTQHQAEMANFCSLARRALMDGLGERPGTSAYRCKGDMWM